MPIPSAPGHDGRASSIQLAATVADGHRRGHPAAAVPPAGRRTTHLALPLALLLAACSLPTPLPPAPPAHAAVRFDFEPYAFVPGDHYVKDHALVARGGVIHLFYTTGTDSLGRWSEPGNETRFGHATSTDLRHWRLQAPVADWAPADWEARNRWAPQVVAAGGGYRMYYTGVNRHIAQSIGIAASRDLEHWQPLADAAFHPDTSWARWRADRWSDCRDPFVLERDGTWWMAVTATTRDGAGALGLARSADGLVWIDAGPLLVGEPGEPLESAQLVEHGGRWWLLFTSGRRGGTWVIEGGGDLHGPWDFSRRRRWLEGVAPEITNLELGAPGGGLWVSRHASYQRAGRRAFVLLFDPIIIGPGGPELAPGRAPGAAGWQRTGDAFLHQPTLDDNPLLRGAAGAQPIGNGWIGTAEAFAHPPDEPGARRGDQATGTLRSPPFTLTGNTLSLWIGGTADPARVYVALRRRADDSVVLRETGSGRERLEQRTWCIAELAGTRVYLELADLDPGGHLNADEIVEHREAEAGGGCALQASPNPFRDSTRITVIAVRRPGAPPGDRRLRIVDAGGRLVRVLRGARSAGDGRSTFVWQGDDQRGRPAAAGFYCARWPAAAGAVQVLRLLRLPSRAGGPAVDGAAGAP